jgi:hypothetical protein
MRGGGDEQWAEGALSGSGAWRDAVITAWREGWAGNGGVAEGAGHDAAARRREAAFGGHDAQGSGMVEVRLHSVYSSAPLSGRCSAAMADGQ